MKKTIGLDEAVALLNAGGWVYDIGSSTAFEQREHTVIGAIVENGVLAIHNQNGYVHKKQVAKLSFEIVGDDTPDTLVVVVTSMVKQQRSPYDGGGFSEKEQVYRQRYVNPAAIERIREREYQEAEERRQREYEAFKASEQAFVAEQRKRLVGATIEGVPLDEHGNLTVQVSGGYTLKVGIQGDGEDEPCRLDIDWNGSTMPDPEYN